MNASERRRYFIAHGYNDGIEYLDNNGALNIPPSSDFEDNANYKAGMRLLVGDRSKLLPKGTKLK